ncbi:MAG: molybdopterin dinucleotide binding domain-containing protein, partial [Vulcanimicrobiaceae bacterium]
TIDPAFAFLADSRPLFDEPAAEPRNQATPDLYVGNSFGSEEAFAAIATSLRDDNPEPQPGAVLQPPAPAIPGARGIDAHSGADPFMMQTDGRGALFVTVELQDGPLPTHYEPLASVIPNQLYKQQHNPLLREWKRRDNRYNGAVNPEYPYVLTTYRITEYSGVMTKYIPWLAELQPAAFCEIDPELAVEKGIRNGGWATISTAIGDIEVRALVTGRMKPLRVGKGQRVHQIGIPYNFGRLGFAYGDSSGDVIPLAMDPNSSIHEAKSLTCNIRAGRRPQRNAATNPVDLDVPPEEKTHDGEAIVHGSHHDFPHEHPTCGD